MPVELGQVLKVIGGAAHLKVGSVIAEKLPITKMLDGGPLGPLLAQALQGGPSALMQNPIGAVSAQLQGAIGTATAALANVSGASGLVSALTGATGLSGAIGGLTQAASFLSGATMPGAGQFGLLDVATHGSITGMLGDALPASMALSQAIGPLNAGSAISAVGAALPGVVAQVVAGTMSVAAATAWVQAQAATLSGITTASNAAFQSAQDAAAMLVSVSAASALLTSSDPTIQALLPMIVQPAALTAMQAAVASHVAP